MSTSIDTFCVGWKRKANYKHGLYFDESIAIIKPEYLIVVNIETDPGNVPPNVMDEHILIGGKQVDIKQDCYSLRPLPSGCCQLSLSSRFNINIPLNWYSGIWAEYLMEDILKGQLKLIKKHSQTNKNI